PYFGFMFVLLMLPVVLLVPFGPFLRWRVGNWRAAVGGLKPALYGAIGVAVVAAIVAHFVADGLPFKAIVGAAASIWVGLGIALYALMRWRNAPRGRRYTPEMLGMILAHFGIAIFLAGVLTVEATSVEKDVKLASNETVALGGFTFRFDGVRNAAGPNFEADQGTLTVLRDDRVVATLHPQKRQYSRRSQVQTESAIDPGLFRDIYVALGEPVGSDGAWAVRIYVKPFVRWIWLGALFMMLGGFVAAADRRFRALPRLAESAKPSSNAPSSSSVRSTAPFPSPFKGEAGRRMVFATTSTAMSPSTPSPPNPPLEGEG
ncbi:MAG TPA: cytochrome c-type biogenesis CcmF C-terminal domain-containing protein, partial [Rhodanobacteraceae bacterium]|nr:cytochrome c-type biogenesis CcmF C-terminal domain-containing protein [Rhodanobacteraceae bacterium]